MKVFAAFDVCIINERDAESFGSLAGGKGERVNGRGVVTARVSRASRKGRTAGLRDGRVAGDSRRVVNGRIVNARRAGGVARARDVDDSRLRLIVFTDGKRCRPEPKRARLRGDLIDRTVGERDDAESAVGGGLDVSCLLYTSPSPRDRTRSRMPSSA